ncbi:hypothetical protein PJE062_1938 [Pseudovibrio sp. JE062]|nr:hypothetical protein PJE062_1938 [Pseudovibrio sp. JE062]
MPQRSKSLPKIKQNQSAESIPKVFKEYRNPQRGSLYKI